MNPTEESVMADQQLADYWHSQVIAWRTSGLSCQAFCDRHDLIYHRFAYWRKKYATRETQEPRALTPSIEGKGSGFAQVMMAAPVAPPNTPLHTSNSSLTLTLPNGIIVSGLQAGNIAWLGALLEQLG